jgi:parallel beta-helix repeat protein
VANASAAGTLPTTINEVVSVNGTLSDPGCPVGLSSVTPTPTVFSNLASAVAAATSGDTIYVCFGLYDMSVTANYGVNEQVVINKSLTIDGYNWDVAPSGSDTSASVDSSTQSEFENGAGILVQSPNVTISGLTFYKNNFDADTPNCEESPTYYACANSIDVQSLVSGPGDQGENGVTISNNLFADTGGTYPATFQNGDVHFGLGQDASTSEPTTDVTALDTGDVVEGNVFAVDVGYENSALQMSDTTGALVTDNTVNYPTNNASGSDDNALSALWFPGFDQGTTISDNTLNGGGIDNDASATPDTDDPKSGIKIIDQDLDGSYGDGCSDQSITGNTISGFVYDISVISTGYDADSGALCSVGPTGFAVSDNTVSDARIYGIYISGATDGTISDNVASDTDTEGYNGYTAGEYDFFDAAGSLTTNTWTNDSGNGSADPSSIDEMPINPPTFPNQVVFTSEPPASTTAGATLASFTVSVEDAYGNVETTGNTGATDSIVLTSSCGLGGTDTVDAIDGVATFNSVDFTGAGSCTLTATDSTQTLTTATSTPATTVTPTTPSQVVFTSEPPATTTAGATLASFAVSIEDTYGNVETTGNTGATDSIVLTSSCGLGGTDTVDAINGVATFNSVDFTGTGSCTLTATDSTQTLTTATSTPATTVNSNTPPPPPPPPPVTTTTTTTTTTTPPPPVTTTTIAPKPKPLVTVSALTLTSANRVLTTVDCARARCAGLLELTKTISKKNELLGRISYALAIGGRRQFSIQLNAEGLKLVRTSKVRRFTCELTITSAAGTKREAVSFTLP